MTTIIKRFGYFGLLLVLLLQSILTANGQSRQFPLQHIVFKDKVLEGNLNGFTNATKYKIISVNVERCDQAFLYKLSGVSFFESVKDHPPRFRGQWRNRIVLLWAAPALKDICTISDSVAFDNLLKYVRPILPDQFSSITTNGVTVHSVQTAHGFEWTFKVENGKEVWLYDNAGYDSRDVIEVPVPN